MHVSYPANLSLDQECGERPWHARISRPCDVHDARLPCNAARLSRTPRHTACSCHVGRAAKCVVCRTFGSCAARYTLRFAGLMHAAGFSPPCGQCMLQMACRPVRMRQSADCKTESECTLPRIMNTAIYYLFALLLLWAAPRASLPARNLFWTL